MSIIKKEIEILSPVGNTEMLEAAVRSGADAVYLGVRDFNARRNADNFDSSTLSDAIKYCHIRGVKVYLTLNTVLSDSELSAALSAAREAYIDGIDAVIVQDLGLARLIHTHLPALPLHASTQLTVHSPSALPALKELGFEQVVLSRELSRDEIAAVCREAERLSMTTEVFVHGALCMCMSGQCYLSAMLGGRSGNRGLCAGPCRLPFKCEGGNRYDLSLKDLSLVEYISELKNLGVKTLKIEGRMKRPEYVAAATAVCRKTVDGEDCSELKDTLYKVFSRSGFTDGYYKGNLGKDMFGTRTKEDVMLSGAVINRLHELYRAERRSVKINGSFSLMGEGVPAVFRVSDGEHTVTVNGQAAEKAKTRAACRENIIPQLEKTGSTPFIFENIETDIADGLAISAGAVNSLRRQALDALAESRYEKRTAPTAEYRPTDAKKAHGKKSLVARFADISQIPKRLDGVCAVVLPLECDFESYDRAPLLCLDIPRGIQNEDYILNRLNTAVKLGVKYAFCGNIAAVTLCKKAGILPVFDFSMNVFNSESASVAEELGAVGITLSPELTCAQINSVKSPLPTGFIGYGRLPLMLTRNCPLKNGRTCAECDKNGTLTDRKGISFPVRCRLGFSELFNSRPLWLAERTDEFDTDFITLYFTFETPDECESVIARYQGGKPACGEYTRGLYYRGVE